MWGTEFSSTGGFKVREVRDWTLRYWKLCRVKSTIFFTTLLQKIGFGKPFGTELSQNNASKPKRLSWIFAFLMDGPMWQHPAFTCIFGLCVPAGRISKMVRVCSSLTIVIPMSAAGKGGLQILFQFHHYLFHLRDRLWCLVSMVWIHDGNCYLRQFKFWACAIIV